jgi:hypothetical protein
MKSPEPVIKPTLKFLLVKAKKMPEKLTILQYEMLGENLVNYQPS